MKNTVLITGVAGFLGQYVEREFRAAGWSVLGLDDVDPARVALQPGSRYLRVKLPDSSLAGLLRDFQPAVCVHCAGSASVGDSMTDPVADFRANTLLTLEVLEALRQDAPGCRLLLLSSAAVYGDPTGLPIGEDAAVAPLSPYGFHKHQAELLCREFSRVYGLSTASVRIFSAYGPGLRRQVVWDICQRVVATGRLSLRGTGRESRDFIHAADVARALTVLATRAPAQGECYNLATGRETSIGELAQLTLNALGFTAEPEFDGINPAGNPLRWRADVSRLCALGFTPSLSLEEGLSQVANWCLAQQPRP